MQLYIYFPTSCIARLQHDSGRQHDSNLSHADCHNSKVLGGDVYSIVMKPGVLDCLGRVLRVYCMSSFSKMLGSEFSLGVARGGQSLRIDILSLCMP